MRVGHNEMEFITVVCAINGHVTKIDTYFRSTRLLVLH